MEGKNSQLQQRKDDALPRGTGNLCQWYVDQAENATLRDVEGNSWIDFAGGIAVLNTGHRHAHREGHRGTVRKIHPYRVPSDALRELCRPGRAH